ncbi:MAG TPA: BMP family ABC transporter substrate-binding protein [Acidimicrobiia bacterium]|nr:BMP family ABC transporter substrate-binding protein [Acidimicrobiia bacterium]
MGGRWLRRLVLISVLALVVGACGDDNGGGDSGDGLKVAFVYVGPIGDAGWTWAHDQGRLYLEENLEGVETTFLESVPEGAEAQRVFEDLAEDGYDLIFGTSFGYMDPMLAAAANYPDVVFEHATGYLQADNLGNYFGAAEEGRYLTGLAAGAATTTNLIGYVAAFPIPEVLRGINAFTIGVREVNPDAQVQVIWTNTWFGPDLERQAAEAALDAGADVIAMHQDSPAPGQAAEARGARWVGYNSDMSQFAPEAWLTAPVWDWGPFYLQRAREVLDGTWTSESFYGDMAGGMVSLAPFGDSVSQETRDLIESRRAAIIDGTFDIFVGPLYDQSGALIYDEGVVPSLGELLGTDYFVQGVIGSPTG